MFCTPTVRIDVETESDEFRMKSRYMLYDYTAIRMGSL